MIKLEDIVPRGSSFHLKKTDKKYRLRVVSMDDELWMNETFGERIQEIFSKMLMREVCRIVFHQLVPEDQTDFAAKDVTVMNEKGETATQRIGGAELLMCLMVGVEEKMEVFRALLETVGVSRPMLDKMIKEEEKKSPPSPPIGVKSSTFSAPNTDGLPSISFRARRGRSTTASKRSRKGKR